ncbi:GntR family transcriptional regulator [Clostridium thermarum]|uniref:GntR family transcriptional regulator n=1 Tax=Clostridium thermarum TaxID=1716543 RepID=UPI0013D4D9F7|nr:GntR family transcriptional regulator [Clostridium thermarum]
MKDIPLYKQIKNHIIDQIQAGVLRAGDRVPSEAELAKLFRVSQITSKNALIELVDEGYIHRVQGKGSFVSQEAPESKTVSNAVIQNVCQNKTGLIGVLFPSLNIKVEFRLLYYLDKYIYDRGYKMLMHNCRESSEEESSAIQSFMDSNVEGLIIFPTLDEHYNESILRLSIEKFPLVLIDRYLKKINTNIVTTDNVQASYDAVNYLIQQGHKKIAYISPEITNSTTEDRAIGFEKAFLENKFSIDKNLWCIIDLKTIDADKDYEHIYAFFRNNPDISAVFTVNNRMLNLTVKSLNALNRRIPDDIEVFTFDEPDSNNINYILQDYKTICSKAVDLLIAQINSTEFTTSHIVVPPKLIFRDNCE